MRFGSLFFADLLGPVLRLGGQFLRLGGFLRFRWIGRLRFSLRLCVATLGSALGLLGGRRFRLGFRPFRIRSVLLRRRFPGGLRVPGRLRVRRLRLGLCRLFVLRLCRRRCLRFLHGPGNLGANLVLHRLRHRRAHLCFHGGRYLPTDIVLVSRSHRRTDRGLHLAVDHRPHLVGRHLCLYRRFDLPLHGLHGQLLFDLGLDRRLVGMANGVLDLCARRLGDGCRHLLQHGGLDLFAHLRLRALAHLLPHDIGDAVPDLLFNLFPDRGLDLLAHLRRRALAHLLFNNLPDARLHLFLHLLARRVVHAVHHELVGGLFHLAHDLLFHGGAHLGGQLPVCLRIDDVFDLVQQLPLEANDFVGIVVDGQRL